jgi:hypothetical protein
MPMSVIPLDIYRIIYRYLYKDVLHQLLSSYHSRKLRLKDVLTTQVCERVRLDINYSLPTKRWRFMKSHGGRSSEAYMTLWLPDWVGVYSTAYNAS